MTSNPILHVVAGGALAYGDPRADFQDGSPPIKAVFAERADAEAYLAFLYSTSPAPRPDDLAAAGEMFEVALPGGSAWAVADL